MRKSDFSDCKLDTAGLFSSEGEWIHPKRILDTHEIILVLNGTVYISEEETEYELNEGDYLLLHSSVTHSGTKATNSNVSFYWFHFHGNAPSYPFFGSLHDQASVMLCAKQLLHIYSSGLYPKETGDNMLRVFLSELEVERELNSHENVLAAKINEYIRSHSDKNLLVSDVSERFGYSADYLSRLLKANCGLTLKQKISKARMEKACLLLQTTDLTVSQISYMLGYKEPNLFEKFFIYHQSCTPKQYRNSFFHEKTNHK